MSEKIENLLGEDRTFDPPLSIVENANATKEWFDLATEKEINDPNAMCLSTVDDKNTPHSRMVLLKDYNDEGFIFYTNYESNKGNDILKNAKGQK